MFTLHNIFCPQIASYFFDHTQIQSTCSALYSEYYKLGLDKIASNSGSIKVVLNLIYGIKFLQEHHLIHRDIKPDNIRITNQYFPKIIDFGSGTSIFSENEEEMNLKKKIFGEGLKSTNGYYVQYYGLSSKLRSLY